MIYFCKDCGSFLSKDIEGKVFCFDCEIKKLNKLDDLNNLKEILEIHDTKEDITKEKE